MTSSKKSLKWSDALTFKFLDLYQQHECLWNQTLSLYKSRDARESALQAITWDMECQDLTSDDIKHKIKSLRTMYKKELNLVLNSIKSGASDIYKPKLVWFDRADTFLRNVSSTRGSSFNLDIATTEDVDEYSNESSGETKFTPQEHCSYDEAESTATSTNNQFVVPSFPTLTYPPQATRQSLQSSQSSQISRKRKLIDINETIDRLNAVRDVLEDEFDHFGKLIASQLRKMPELDALMCEERIQDVIRKKRLEILKNASPNSSCHYSRTPSPC